MTQALGKSLNTGVIFAQKQVGNQTFFRYLQDFGFGQPTGVQLPNEASGNLSNLKSGRNIEYYTASFGQGITVTPIQLVTAYGVMANGGELVTPRIVDYRQTASGEKEVSQNRTKKNVISSSAARQVTWMMATNVDKGHGRLASVPGYQIAGKTGTAQIPNPEGGGYLEDETIGSFAGYGPVDDPRFVMAVIIDRPKGVEWAEHSAAPVFGEMAKIILDYYGAEPSRGYTDKELDQFYSEHNFLGESSLDFTLPETEREGE
jgi:cell division protein FtsI/penicillin-binding protein 2